jgi:hypothetical protein
MRDLKDTQPGFYDVFLACIRTATKIENSHFNAKECGTITGEAEALYGWIAANYSLGFFSGYGMRSSQTVEYVEMGGASAQIAYKLVLNNTTVRTAKAGAELQEANEAYELATRIAKEAKVDDHIKADEAVQAAREKVVRAKAAVDTVATANDNATERDRSGGLDDYEGQLAKVKIGALEFDLFLGSYALGLNVAKTKYNEALARLNPRVLSVRSHHVLFNDVPSDRFIIP